MTAASRLTLDTNILIYAIDASAGRKHSVARSLVLRAAAAHQPLMLQSLNELCAVATRKRFLDPAKIVAAVEFHRDAFPLIAANANDLTDAVSAHHDHNLPFWDALLWATARRAGCRLIVSEDFQDGRTLGGVLFRNPFAKKLPVEIDELLS
ncbi:PIN domain-containing protein [Edaphobacter bradus]|uniref:PIN domain-containing protein n=1 Tax=Edaphobacter bradus TaxID=2259016 RepID=UPI0021E05467|nr:PIN domain-containing protein [Edaphobacter bradus]